MNAVPSTGHHAGVTLRARWTAALLAVAALAACAGPSRSDDDFKHKAANTAEAMRGLIATANIVSDAAARGDVPGPYASVTLADADDDASAVVESFDSRQPPSGAADKLRDRLDPLLTNVVSVLDDLRIAARRGDLEELADIARPLDQLDAKLQVIEELA